MHDETRCVIRPEVDLTGYKSLAAPVHRASTIVFDSAAEYAARGDRGPDGYSYGLYGTPTSKILEAQLTDLAGGVRTLLVPSGQGANAIAMMAVLSAGDHILVSDSCYPATRANADEDFRRLGIEAEYYDPSSIEDLERRLRPETRLIWCESPGSTTMEVQDLPAIVQCAKKVGALTGCDNTWATSLGLRPLALGMDIVTEALTKYASGHSDLLMGAITFADEDRALGVRRFMGRMGIGVSPDDAAMVLRGMETMALRYSHASRVATQLIARIQRHDAVSRVLWPPLPDSPGHEIFRRDFTGSAGVFSVVLKAGMSARLEAALDTMETIAIGASWGGTRSLIAPMSINKSRSVLACEGEDLFLRISIGVEHPDDLEADIDRLLNTLSAGNESAEGKTRLPA